jgi:hypothetical protein
MNSIVAFLGKQIAPDTRSGNFSLPHDLFAYRSVQKGHATMTRNCDQCGSAYKAQRSTSRFCSGPCRRRNGGRPAPPRPPAEPSEATKAFLAAVRAELEASGRLGTWQGQALLLLAEAMCTDQPPATLATLSAEFLRARRAAMEDVPAAADDPLDELKRRRDRKSR